MGKDRAGRRCTADGCNVTEVTAAQGARQFLRVKARNAIGYKRAMPRGTALDVLRRRSEQTDRRGIKRACRGSPGCFQICVRAATFSRVDNAVGQGRLDRIQLVVTGEDSPARSLADALPRRSAISCSLARVVAKKLPGSRPSRSFAIRFCQLWALLRVRPKTAAHIAVGLRCRRDNWAKSHKYTQNISRIQR